MHPPTLTALLASLQLTQVDPLLWLDVLLASLHLCDTVLLSNRTMVRVVCGECGECGTTRRAHRTIKECRHQMFSSLRSESRLLGALVAEWKAVKQSQKTAQAEYTEISLRLHSHPGTQTVLSATAEEDEIAEQQDMYWTEIELKIAKLRRQVETNPSRPTPLDLL